MNLFELFIKIGLEDEASRGIEKMGAFTIAKGQLMARALEEGIKLIAEFTGKTVESYAEFEQLAGGAAKIFNEMDQSKILNDANNAYKDLGLSANQYLAIINDVGATFAATMGDEAGYNTARQGLQAISDYASGTGKNVDLLSQKFMMITRSSASYQSIADQFSGILPATSAAFLEQAQSVGVLDGKYTKLTEVPIDEYQAAVSAMLEQGVKDLGLYGNTVAESETTVSGSINAMKASWENLITAFGDENANVDKYMDVFLKTVQNVVDNIVPVIFTAIPNILKAGVTLIQNLANGILNNQGAVSDGTVQTIDMLLDTIISLLPSIIAAGITIVAQLVIGLIRSIPRIIEIAPELIDALTVGLKMVYDRLIASGAEIVDKIKSGISNAWNDLVSWFNSLWDSLFSDRNVNVNVDYGDSARSSRAGGLDYVPYDGYIAMLHKGEKVLTADEAKGYNGNRTGVVNVVQNIYSEAKTAADLMQEALYQQERAVYLGV